jgi:hypothetical protein
MQSITLPRTLRNIREAIKYPIWFAAGRPPPDNHYYKVNRIKSIGLKYNCSSFIETGTFLGQTVAAVNGNFEKSLSVELKDSLYEANRRAFAGRKSVALFHGDSGSLLGEMIDQATGRILFWLDGHFSGGITALGKEVTPILGELSTIKMRGRRDDCILIDDIRLFVGNTGYPTQQAVQELILSMSADYAICTDRDCLMALPKSAV